jgi:serine/threonine-protein kinase RsbW
MSTVSSPDLLLRLKFSSAPEMTDFVEVIGNHVTRRAGLDDDSGQWVNVAVRECVVNAIKHGNRSAAERQVFVEFEVRMGQDGPELVIRVRDEGEGFDIENVADPLAPENLLKTSGRGIFLIRSFMDDVTLRKLPQGGMEVIMIKRVPPAPGVGDTFIP